MSSIQSGVLHQLFTFHGGVKHDHHVHFCIDATSFMNNALQELRKGLISQKLEPVARAPFL